MTLSRAVAVAVRSMRSERQSLAFDAGVARRLGPGAYLRGDRALAAYDELSSAVELLNALAKEGAHDPKGPMA